jgi:methionine biosynthesis protein MetW
MYPFDFPWIRKPEYSTITRIDYDEYWKSRGWCINKKLKERESIIHHIVNGNTTVLDIGCGNSLLPIKLREKGCRVSVADICQTVLNEYKKLDFDVIRIDLNKPGEAYLENMKFDYIIFSEVLEHIANPEEVIQFYIPYASNIIITVPNSAFIWFRVGLLLRGRFFTQWVHHPSEHLRYWSHIDFIDWLKAMHLTVINIWPSNGTRLLKRLWPNMFGLQIVYLCQPRNIE